MNCPGAVSAMMMQLYAARAAMATSTASDASGLS